MNKKIEKIKTYFLDRPELIIEILYQLLVFILLFSTIIAASRFFKLDNTNGENFIFSFILFILLNFYSVARNYKNNILDFSRNPKRYTTAVAVPLFKIIPTRNEEGKIKWTRIDLFPRSDGEPKN